MAMMKTGNPVPTTPVELMDGYKAFMSNQPLPPTASTLFTEGWKLAEKVKQGSATAPSWASSVGA